MKICFVCNEYPPMPANGIGVFVQTLAERLAAMGEEIWVMGYGRKSPAQFTQNGVHVRWITLPHPLYRSVQVSGYPLSIAALIKRHYLSLRLNQLVRAQKIDLVECNDFNGPLAVKPTCPLVVRLQGSVTVYRHQENRPEQMNPLDRAFERRQIEMADGLIAVSKHIGEATNNVFHFNRPFEVIYNCVDTDFFRPQPGAFVPGRILFVGNVMWRKGYSLLLQAAPEILRLFPQAYFDFAGGVGGVHQQQVDTEMARLPENVRAKVNFMGRVAHDDLPSIYNRASVFVFPSLVEAFGITCAEAMACARPVVVTKYASGPELIEDTISGYLADPIDTSELALKICTIMDRPELAERLGKAARRRALEKFSLNDSGARNLEYYHSFV